MVHQIDGSLGTSIPIFVLVPIIVTTADLWRIRPRVTIEGIRASSEISDIAEQRDILFLHREPDNQLIRHTQAAFDNGFNEVQKKRIDAAMEVTKEHSYKSYRDNFAHRYPSLFVLIHYNRLENSLERLLSFFDRTLLIKERAN